MRRLALALCPRRRRRRRGPCLRAEGVQDRRDRAGVGAGGGVRPRRAARARAGRRGRRRLHGGRREVQARGGDVRHRVRAGQDGGRHQPRRLQRQREVRRDHRRRRAPADPADHPRDRVPRLRLRRRGQADHEPGEPDGVPHHGVVGPALPDVRRRHRREARRQAHRLPRPERRARQERREGDQGRGREAEGQGRVVRGRRVLRARRARLRAGAAAADRAEARHHRHRRVAHGLDRAHRQAGARARATPATS